MELIDRVIPHRGFRYTSKRNDIGLFRVTIMCIYKFYVENTNKRKNTVVENGTMNFARSSFPLTPRPTIALASELDKGTWLGKLVNNSIIALVIHWRPKGT